MSEATDFAKMTLKDLRALAGERKIKNRSKLSKAELISALEAGDGEAAAPAKSDDKAAPDNKAATKAKPAPAHDQEPEVLDPTTIAEITGETPVKAQPASEKKKAEETAADDSSEADADSDSDEDRFNEDGTIKKRRRRRRRGGRGRNRNRSENGEGSDDQENTDSADSNSAETAASGAERKSESKDRPERQERKADDSKRVPRDNKRDGTPKPRLEGDQPRLPAVLGRLQTFAGGILELCDPDTPAWAQARLSELLADAGVVPIPCHGKPHRDFHEIVGSLKNSEVAPGHIAIIEAPGFALRGDRGDLFALRKAKVRVADFGKQGEEDSEDGDSPAEAEAEELALINDEAATDAPSDAVPANNNDEAPAESVAVASDEAKDSEEAPSRNRRRSRGRRSRSSGDREAQADDAESDLASGSTTDPTLSEPDAKVRDADESPHLPLEPQEAEELAARPKAEGWRHLGLHEQILADLHDVGFTEPTPIQDQAINIAMSGVDMIGQSQTGSGKTAAFLLPMLHRLYTMDGTCPAALVMCPTRELARQVHTEFLRMAGKSGARAALIYGGVGMDDQFKALARHPHVVIGTPGRLIDHAKRRTLDLSNLAAVILDEADQMLDIGFLPDIEWVLKHTPPKRQMLLFSATMPEEIRKLANKHMNDPQTIHIAPKSVTVEQVDQKYIAVDQNKKTSLLAHFIETHEPEQLVVFCNTKHQTDRVATVLKKKKLSAQAIHGDLPQGKRERTLQGFREGTLNCLIATNVAARGIDIPSVSHVVNYDIPENPEEYVHRVGRTARMGRQGVARTFVTPEDGQFVVEIEKHIGLLLEEEVVDGMQEASTATKPQRTIASSTGGPRLLKPLVGGIRLGRGRRR